MSFFVGTGGWADNPAPLNSLRRYGRVFNFVEVNATFYSFPSPSTFRRWRAEVPRAFRFAVKCNRVVSHQEGMRPTARALRALDEMARACSLLEARVLVLQTPSYLALDREAARNLRELLSTLSGEARVALDPGGRRPRPLDPYFVEAMKELRIIHAVDLLREEPAYVEDVLYCRLFGLRVEEAELLSLHRRLLSLGARENYLAFHHLKMVRPALRFMEIVGGKIGWGPLPERA